MFLAMGYGVYFFFASLMIGSVIFIYFLLPETKSVPLEAMDRLFEIKPVRRANKQVIAEVRAKEEEFRHTDEAVRSMSVVSVKEKNMRIENVEV